MIGGLHERARDIAACSGDLLILFPPTLSYAYDQADAQRATDELGISLPPEIMERPPVAKQLGALSRERCDQKAVYQLAKELEDESYRREAAEGLVRFSDNCGGYADGLRRAINLMLDVSDYSRSVEIADKLIEMEPNNDNSYFLRALAYDQGNQCEKAIPDYSSAIELFGDKDKISSVGYEKMSRCYEQMGQYCDAMLPTSGNSARISAKCCVRNFTTRAFVRSLAT